MVHQYPPRQSTMVLPILCLMVLIISLEAFSLASPLLKTRTRHTILGVSSVDPPKSSGTTSQGSTAAQWHRDRRQQMLTRYPEISQLEKTANSQSVGGSFLALANLSLTLLAILCGRLSNWKLTFLLALFPGSIFSLWQLQILHDNLHGSLLDKSKRHYNFGPIKIPKKKLQQWILFWGSMPSIFGYYLYLQYGHLTHHQAVGNPQAANLQTIFESSSPSFEDGDVLFVAHRMKLKGGIGPRFTIGKKEIVMSISNLGFRQWKTGRALFNMGVFATSFLYERLLLVVNDIVVAVAGKNYFFLNKPPQFHKECARYCRAAVATRALIWWLGGKSWHSLWFLYLAETLWSLPPHPAAAMFVTNHGSRPNNNKIRASPDNACIPSSSTYAGKWYSCLTLGTNYHCEHHDFPTIPLQQLGALRQIAPEFYREGSNDRLWPIMVQAFAYPDYYACMNDMESIR
ncbi:Sphingolipid delta(4)-desaturase/C4-monooxygenase [Seminavis robusta]|uniref:Sphingolipid delta(4)-desaturase/C4-monooxygenase n=1 Tax=Seminavis robusta TaxID=568900 RepID=A0A9N8HYI5_9STRA|nr:Sphingolipid delta(4)-desaturase/C4-monooxygenase [Seminavis robusta]|eukprot:Sro2004_g310400.1 Sphingolipid delta(4)-desaturase/C4-monooxygenase (458) ;mRNA; r:1672-3045